MNIENWVYHQLTRSDEWAENDIAKLRSQLFGDSEWSKVNETEWVDSHADTYLWYEDMGS